MNVVPTQFSPSTCVHVYMCVTIDTTNKVNSRASFIVFFTFMCSHINVTCNSKLKINEGTTLVLTLLTLRHQRWDSPPPLSFPPCLLSPFPFPPLSPPLPSHWRCTGTTTPFSEYSVDGALTSAVPFPIDQSWETSNSRLKGEATANRRRR